VYVNQVGAIDELVFDGNSLVYNKEGTCTFDGKLFVEEVAFHELGTDKHDMLRSLDPMDIVCRQLLTGLKDYCDKSGFKQVVIGSSGGIET